MRLPRLLIVSLCLGLFGLSLFAPLPVAHAQGQVSPYTVTVPVKDTSDAQRDDAFGTALSQVMARVAGGQDLRTKAGYADALKAAPGMVQQYHYQRGTPAQGGISLQVIFDQGAVQRAVSQMGVASNAATKPPVLLLVRDEDGSVLTRDALAALAQTAATRGYSVVLADPSKVTDTPTVTNADPEQLVTLARQYKTGLILLGQLRSNNADWNLVSGGPQQRWSNTAADNGALLTDAGNALADRLGKQLNVIGAGNIDGKIWVSDVRSAMDYANLLGVLRADPMLHQVATLSAQGDGMLLSVKAGLPMTALAVSLTAGGRLLQGEAHSGADISLRWVH
ncbi:DUF2066 domain-containing protein [Dyella tabacisoli]|uniref:DUF2066 domain-containing protein n=2 Tax=Dyella tabacisoli TaxID=2282381 RepID=A0A369UID4_9GAMM|nr:DUF2066 domain-containing protein [Dyella tabacisoli]